jgi:hypothetical protein
LGVGVGVGLGLGLGSGLGLGLGSRAVWVVTTCLRSTEKKKKPPPLASENWCCPVEISPVPSLVPPIEDM